MKRRRTGASDRFTALGGVDVLLERDASLPLVDVQLVVRTGALDDPPDRDGMMRVLARLMRHGPRGTRSEVFEERVATLGGRLSIQVTSHFVRFHLKVLRRSLAPSFALLVAMVREPALRPKELSRLKREMLGELVANRDDDTWLVGRAFRRFLFGAHPYGRGRTGRPETIAAVSRRELLAQHERIVRADNLVLAFSGDVTSDEARALVEAHLGDLPTGRPPRPRVGAPKVPRGRRVLIVDKPSRTQVQLQIGTLGVKARDPDLFPLMVADTAFGGTFTARLMYELRSVRGWTYGAYSRLSHDRQREAWSMWATPELDRAADCAFLELSMLEQWVGEGIDADELRAAKSYLANGHCFAIDTAEKRVDRRLDVILYGLREDHMSRFPSHVRAVTRKKANAALARLISPRDVAIVAVAPAEAVRDDLAALPGVRSVEVLPFDRV